MKILDLARWSRGRAVSVMMRARPSHLSCLALLLGAMLAVTFFAACGDGPTEPPPVPNRAPVASGSIPAQTVSVGESATVSVASAFSDPDGDALTYAVASSAPGVASATVSGTDVTVTGVAAGTATLTVTATDPGGLSAEQGFEVTVPNRAPVASGSIPAQTVSVGESATVSVASAFSDPDGDALTYAVASSAPGVASATVSGTDVTVTGVAAGTATLTVTATDPGGLSAEQGFEVTVPNRAPVASGSIPAQTVSVGESATVSVASAFSDPDGDALTYAVASSAPGVASATVSGTDVTVTGVAAGTATLTVTATDPGGLSAEQGFEVTVPNRAPVASGSIPAQTVSVGESATVSVASAFSDPDGDALTYAVASSAPGVASATVSGTDVTVTGVAAGTATLTVTATDPGGLSAEQGFEVTVPNRAPVASGSIPAQTVSVGESATVSVASAFSDPDGDALTYAVASSAPGVASATVSGTDVTVTGVAAGTATLTVTATDPGGLSAEQGFEVTVPNRAPVASGSIPAQTVSVGESATVSVASAFSDPDGDALTYAVASSAPGVASATVSGTDVTVTGVAAGTATLTVTATDPGGLSAEQGFEVTVPNRAPVASGSIPAQTVSVGESATVSVASAFSDPDGDALTYAVASSAPGVASATVSGTDVTVTGVAAGTATLTVTATDPGGLSAEQGFEVTVPNRAPVASGSIPAQTVSVGESATVSVASAFSDPDGDALTYAVASSAPGVASATVSGTDVTVTGVSTGTATLTVTATDPGGLSAEQGFEVTVPNRTPVAVRTIADMVVAVDDSAVVDVAEHFTDPDGDALIYAATSSSTAIARVTLAGGVATVVARAEGRATIAVTARDPEGLTARQTFTVTVAADPDRAVLEALYAALGDYWRRDTNWSTDAPLHTWYGVTTEGGRVVRLSLADNNLIGAIPPVLGNLSNLEYLALDRNRLTGTIPPVLGDLSNLDTLRLNYNSLTGEIPPELGNLSNLERLNLSNNSLTGEIPPELGNLSNLERLNLSNNSLGGVIPPELGNLSNLRSLILSSNSLNGEIPPELGNLSNLEYLSLSSNSLNGALPLSLASLSALAQFYYTKTGLCIPADASFREWLNAIADHRGSGRGCDGNRSPVTTGTIRSWMLDPGDTATVDASRHFRDPDNEALTYSAASSDANVARASVSGSTVTITAVARGRATITVTARDPGGLTASQRPRVTVGRAPARNARPSLTRVGRFSIRLTWSPVERATFYKVNYCSGLTGRCHLTIGYRVVKETTDTTYTHGIGTVLGSHNYIVQACNELGCSSLASSAAASVQGQHSGAGLEMIFSGTSNAEVFASPCDLFQ